MINFIKSIIMVAFKMKASATHYIRADMENITFTNDEFQSLKKNDESICDKLTPAFKSGKKTFIILNKNKCIGLYKV